MKNLLLVIVCFFYFSTCFSQEGVVVKPIILKDTTIVNSKGIISWKLPSGLSMLIEDYKKENYKEPGLDGYRIQVFSDGGNNAKERAQKLVEELQSSYPKLMVYLSYQQPNFKVRCGDYRTKAEARKNQALICKNYPGCFIVQDHILIN